MAKVKANILKSVEFGDDEWLDVVEEIRESGTTINIYWRGGSELDAETELIPEPKNLHIALSEALKFITAA